MTIYYVDSAATGANDGTSWTNAWTSLDSAFTNVTTAGDVIYISHTHNEQLAADTTYTVGANHVTSNPLKIYSVDKNTNEVTTGAFIGHSSLNRSILFRGNLTGLYVCGVTFYVAGSSSESIGFYNAKSNAAAAVFESCSFVIINTSSYCRFSMGFSSNSALTVLNLEFLNCSFQFGHISQYIVVGNAFVNFINCSMAVGSIYPTTLIRNSSGGTIVSLIGCDLSNNDEIFSQGSSSFGQVTGVLQQCRMKSGFVLLNATMTVPSVRATLLDCDSGDVHYRMAHADYFGELQMETGIYCNDNIADTDLSWKIVSSANASFTMPYVTPWISVYHSGTSAITPYLEILRSGSSTAFTDAEVWAEWSYKGTSGSTRATVDSDRCAPLGTPANQTTSSKTASDWTGENATSWFGKIGPSASITPAEAGDLSFRICVGAPSTTVYVDPQIRGLT